MILTKEDWTDHVHKLELTLNKLKEKGLKCDIEKSFIRQTEMEYLGTHDGVKTTNRKIEAITNMNPPTLWKELQTFIGVVNYYCDMWPRRSHKLVPLTILMSIKRRFKWTQVKQDVF